MSDDVTDSLGQIRDALAALNSSLSQLVKLLGPQVVVGPPKSVRVRDDRQTQSYVTVAEQRERIKHDAGSWRDLCQHDGCASTKLVGDTAYCERHVGDVRG